MPAGVPRVLLLRPILRGLLWGLLGAVLVLLGVLAVRSRSGRTAPPPVLAALPGFLLTDQHGREVRLNHLAGSPWIADFIFTRCPGPCPLMSRKMAELAPRLPPGVRRVSFTVDPDYDTPEVLAAYAGRFGAGPDWLFLTGPRDGIWDLSVTGFKLGVAEAEGLPQEEGPIVHSTRFVLVDGEARIRGYYDAFDPKEVARLLRELRAVVAER
jgi:protein SCO1/2